MRWSAALACLAASWGAIAVIAVAVDLEASGLAFARLLVAAVTLALVALISGRVSLLAPGTALPGLALLGVLQGAHWVLFFETAKRGSVALAVLTFYLAPTFIAVAAPRLLGERRAPVAIAGLSLGTIGVVLVVLGGSDGVRPSAGAVAAGLASAATFAGLVLVAKRLLSADVQPMTIAFWNCAVGAIAVAPLLVFADRLMPAGRNEWLGVLALGVVFTALSVLAYTALMRHVTAQTAGILTFLEPVSGAALAWLFLGEELGILSVVGAAIIVVAGLVVVVFGPDASRVVEPTAPVGSATA